MEGTMGYRKIAKEDRDRELKNVQIRVDVSKVFKQDLEGRAVELGISMSQYIRWLVNKDLEAVKLDEFYLGCFDGG
jgi:hypothetical protein